MQGFFCPLPAASKVPGEVLGWVAAASWDRLLRSCREESLGVIPFDPSPCEHFLQLKPGHDFPAKKATPALASEEFGRLHS